MQVTSHYIDVPLRPAVNPGTAAASRDNRQRELVQQPSQAEAYPRQPSSEQAPAQTSTALYTAAGVLQQTATTDARRPARTGAHEQSELNEPSATADAEAPAETAMTDAEVVASDDEEQASAEDSDQHGEPLDEQEQAEVEDLKARDEEVRTHEQAHAAAGGQYAGSPSYDYEIGPNGRRYVSDGEVSIDTSKVPDDPQATLDKAQQVKRTALAPAEPSAQDRRVAAEASQMAAEARREINEQRAPDSDDGDDEQQLPSGQTDIGFNHLKNLSSEQQQAHQAVAERYQQSSAASANGVASLDIVA